MSRAKVYGLLMALAMLFMAGLCACSAQPHSAAETAPQTIVVGVYGHALTGDAENTAQAVNSVFLRVLKQA